MAGPDMLSVGELDVESCFQRRRRYSRLIEGVGGCIAWGLWNDTRRPDNGLSTLED